MAEPFQDSTKGIAKGCDVKLLVYAATAHRGLKSMDGARSQKHILLGGAGVLLGGAFLWLAMRNVNPADIRMALRQMDAHWLIAGATVYLASIVLRCLRWGILLRATSSVKWRHAAEALVTGYAANLVLPGRIGEFFRADYTCRIFNMNRFASLRTIVVERVCDGILLVCVL
jgi:glycosyltransferase 2 family protein